ncbi:unnamed protein product [Paramecium sonneborni]|uniref:Uncharacterized protein n=1 Tax=Paramecium sonneborni TaxID=65129 RepID=A0A8S1PTF5_9CILI|nr:unnamed protein product [Paramecium sonneborni]
MEVGITYYNELNLLQTFQERQGMGYKIIRVIQVGHNEYESNNYNTQNKNKKLNKKNSKYMKE